MSQTLEEHVKMYLKEYKSPKFGMQHFPPQLLEENVGIVHISKQRIHYIYRFLTYYINVSKVMQFISRLTHRDVEGMVDGVSPRQGAAKAQTTADHCLKPTNSKTSCDLKIFAVFPTGY